MQILLIDNNDSFTGNLEHLLAVTCQSRPTVVPYARLKAIDSRRFDLTVISAGPGHPADYPNYRWLLETGRPILGICMGMQIINDYFGGETAQLPDCIHGRTDVVNMAGRRFVVARYHSLYLRKVAACLQVTAVNDDGVPMAVQHRSRPMIAYQFHPESFLTPDGGYFIDYATRVLNLA